MRSVIAVVSAVAMLVAQMPPGFAQSAVPVPAQPAAWTAVQDATVDAAIVDAFKAFPKGGDLLSKRIADIIVKNPQLAVGMVKYVQMAPDLSKEQKVAAERGLAAALNRLGINAADMPVKAPRPAPVAEVYDYSYLLGLLAIAGIICLGLCRKHDDGVPVVPVSPN
jgi:hypothetical protein